MRRKWLVPLLLLALPACGTTPQEEPDPVPEESPELEPTPEELAAQAVEDLLSSLTLEEQVGQLFFVRCPETGGAELAAQYKVGGYLLFGRDFKDKTYAQVRALTDALQRSAAVPLLIGADEEGGTGTRAGGDRGGGAGHQRAPDGPGSGHRGCLLPDPG